MILFIGTLFAIKNNINVKIRKMKIDDFIYKRVPLMNKALDAYSLRMTTSAKNIANANTTGYKPERVKFEELFRDQMAIQGTKTDTRHIPVGRLPEGDNEKIERVVPVTEIMKSGENNFDIDKEMAEVAETQIRYQFVSQSVSKHFKLLSAAITGNPSF